MKSFAARRQLAGARSAWSDSDLIGVVFQPTVRTICAERIEGHRRRRASHGFPHRGGPEEVKDEKQGLPISYT